MGHSVMSPPLFLFSKSFSMGLFSWGESFMPKVLQKCFRAKGFSSSLSHMLPLPGWARIRDAGGRR